MKFGVFVNQINAQNYVDKLLFVLVLVVSQPVYSEVVHSNGPIYSNVDGKLLIAETSSLSDESEVNILDIRLGSLKKGSNGLEINVVPTAFSSVETEFTVSFDSQYESFFQVPVKFECLHTDQESRCDSPRFSEEKKREVTNSKAINPDASINSICPTCNTEIEGKNLIFFPFDSASFKFLLKTIPNVSWSEVNVYNSTNVFETYFYTELEGSDSEFYLQGEMSRDAKYKIIYVFIAIGCMCLLYFVATVRTYYPVIVGIGFLFVLAAMALKKIYYPPQFDTITLFDLTLLSTAGLMILFAARRALLFVFPKYGIFISYRRIDASAEATFLYDRLCKEFTDVTTFFDEETIDISSVFPTEIQNAIQSSSVFFGSYWAQLGRV